MNWTDIIYNKISLLLFTVFVVPLQIFCKLKKSSKNVSNIETTWVKRSNSSYVKTSGRDLLMNLRNCSNTTEFLKLAKMYILIMPVLLLKSRAKSKSSKSINPDIYIH